MFKSDRIQYFLIILTFLIFACISDICIIHTQVLFNAHDMLFHLKRVWELYNVHYLPSFSFNYFHGSAVMSMYPYLSLFPLVILLHITSSYIYAYYYFFIVVIFLSLLIAFFSSLKFSKSVYISYLFAILYSFSISFLINYFNDGDLGITTSLIFLPMVIFGIQNILTKSKNYIQLSLGLTFMLFCQIPSTIVAISFVIILILLNINKLNECIYLNLLKSVVLTACITSIFWIPLLKIILFNRISTPTSSHIQSANIVSIVKNIGIIPILFLPILFFYIKEFNRFTKQMYYLSIIIIIISSRYIPLMKAIASLKFMNFINTFQFTARFLIIPQIILCYLSSWMIIKCINNLRKFKLLFIGTIILILFLQLFIQMFIVHNEFDNNYRYANNYSSIRMINTNNSHYMIKNTWIKYLRNGYINNDDYYPISSICKQKYINNNEATYENNKIIYVKHKGYNLFSFNSSNNISKLVLPILHYNDEHFNIYLNHHLKHYYINRNKLITLKNIKEGKNTVYLEYVPNMWLVILKWLLLLIGIIYLVIHLINVFYCGILCK